MAFERVWPDDNNMGANSGAARASIDQRGVLRFNRALLEEAGFLSESGESLIMERGELFYDSRKYRLKFMGAFSKKGRDVFPLRVKRQDKNKSKVKCMEISMKSLLTKRGLEIPGKGGMTIPHVVENPQVIVVDLFMLVPVREEQEV